MKLPATFVLLAALLAAAANAASTFNKVFKILILNFIFILNRDIVQFY